MSDTDATTQEQAAATATETQEPDHKAEAEKWKALARKHETQAKQNLTAAQELEKIRESEKTEAQKAADKAAEAEGRATTAERTAMQIDVALDKAPDGMSLAQLRKLAKRLAGATREELEADAEELFAEFAPTLSDKGGDTRGRPKERLRSGAVAETEPTSNMNDFIRAGITKRK